jgi:pimeloyl-ACP methyl ester carboxylesterase
MPSAKEFQFAFTNTFTEEDSAKAYERYAIAASRNVLFTGVNANLNPATPLKVDFRKSDRAPLLFIAGGKDHVVPAAVNRHNAAKYRKSSAITDIVEFPERVAKRAVHRSQRQPQPGDAAEGEGELEFLRRRHNGSVPNDWVS